MVEKCSRTIWDMTTIDGSEDRRETFEISVFSSGTYRKSCIPLLAPFHVLSFFFSFLFVFLCVFLFRWRTRSKKIREKSHYRLTRETKKKRRMKDLWELLAKPSRSYGQSVSFRSLIGISTFRVFCCIWCLISAYCLIDEAQQISSVSFIPSTL